jgi:hypothetical protein
MNSKPADLEVEAFTQAAQLPPGQASNLAEKAGRSGWASK